MEHIIVTELKNGFYRLIPEINYKLFNIITEQYYSEAITKTPKQFVAVKE